MPHPRFYNPENVVRVRYAQIALALVAAVVCGYLAITTVLNMRGVWDAENSLRRAKAEAANLSRQASSEEKREATMPPPRSGGVDSFAVQVAGWARPRGISVESLIPEGSPTITEVAAGGAKLGTWAAHRVRVKGCGEFMQLMSLLDELKTTNTPVRLETFALQSAQSAGRGMVSFDLVLTVYEKKSGAG